MMQEKRTNMKQLAIGMAAYTSASILGPLVIFGGLGIFLDNRFQKDSFYTIICIIIAFFFTNALLFKKVRKINAMMVEIGEEAKRNKKLQEKKQTEDSKQENKK